MAEASGIRAGRAFVELALSDSKFIRGLQGALVRLKAFGVSLKTIGSDIQGAGLKMTALGTGIVAPMLLAAKSFASTGDQLDKMSKRTGASVEALSELGHAATLSGASLEDVETGIKHMQRAIAAAAGGSKAAQDALASLGLTASQLQGMLPDQQFELIGRRLSAIQDPASRAAAAMELFGRSGTTLLPMMENLGALREEARRLGLVMSTEDAQAAAVLNDAMDRLWATLRRVVVTIGSTLAPLLTEWSEKLSGIAASSRAWITRNQDLLVSLLKVGLGVTAVGAGLLALGSVVSGIGNLFAFLVNFTLVASKAMFFLLSPVGLVTLAVVALAGAILSLTETGAEIRKWIDELKKLASEPFDIKASVQTVDEAAAERLKAEAEELKKLLTQPPPIPAGAPTPEVPSAGVPGALEPIPGMGFLQKIELTVPEDLSDRFGEVTTPGERRRPPIQEQARQAMDVIGTFNAAGVSKLGVGASAVEERTAKAAEQTAKNTADIRRKMLEGGALVFE